MKKLIIANWKCNPDSPGRAAALAKKIDRVVSPNNVEVVIAPPFPFLLAVRSVLKKSKLGAQNVFWEDVGPYTGEVSWHQLQHLRVEYVVVGHSERRMWLHETDEMVGKKVSAALKAGLKVILCVGEPLAVRKQGTAAVLRYTRNQLSRAVRNVPLKNRGRIVVAYEPIWAVSTGLGIPCDSFEAEQMVHACAAYLAIKEKFRDVRGIYGGSVDGRNIKLYLDMEYIDGALVGGASLKAEEFKKIIKIASKI